MPLIGSKPKPKEQEPQSEVPRIRLLWQKANAGDKEALAKVRQMLDEHPEVWRQLGDLAQIAERALVQQLASCDRLMAEAAEQQVAQLRKELLGDRPSSLLKAAVDRVVTTALAVNVSDVLGSLAGPESPNARYWAQQQARQLRRHATALRLLEVTRRMERAEAQSRRP
jgi:hypothetical protein